MPNNFLLKMQLTASESFRLSAASLALVECVVFVLEEFVPSVVLLGELSEKVTRALVGLDL